jgi:hypothetical protein
VAAICGCRSLKPKVRCVLKCQAMAAFGHRDEPRSIFAFGHCAANSRSLPREQLPTVVEMTVRACLLEACAG